ncbi:dihydroorotate dehydrogenase B (NAD(+)), electron transfer subunit [Bacteroidia bacterium]|nr:dihydroorotate dehydrogenase B (NAD(+)), electron transfer subunit [Bacteroidia bacterium]GHT82594.1 dihydroorotate dehydrogenase B (NAD(+)), electron transfer subunit [Bacteroidia bacterium]
MQDINFVVERLSFLNSRVFALQLRAVEPLPHLHCGQFIHIKPAVGDLLLRRPFCLYKFGNRRITLIIAVVGKGTEQLSHLKKGDEVKGIVPLGNGFTLGNEHQKIALVGGGIGCAPLFTVPQCYPNRQYRAYLGFADKDNVLFADDFSQIVPTLISTDDGSVGFKGYVNQLITNDLPRFQPDVILTCGPVPMLKSVARLAAEHNIPAYASMEARMGCGVGACLVCICAIRNANGTTHNVRVCAEGPVFDLQELVL